MLTYTIQLNRDGVVRFKTTVPATQAGLIGDYRDGIPYQPDAQRVYMALPYQYRAAFRRRMQWWQSSCMSGRHMPLMCHLTGYRGAPMGTLYATPDWVAGGAE